MVFLPVFSVFAIAPAVARPLVLAPRRRRRPRAAPRRAGLVGSGVVLAGLWAALLAAAPAQGVEPDPIGVWPLAPAPEVVAHFDPPAQPWGPGHRGVDLLGHAGARVRAALPGTVSFAGRLAGRGVVVVDHGPTRTTYEPVTAEAAVGAAVRAGEPLGSLEAAGSHCAPRTCLHWGWIRDAETYLDPLRLVGGGPVRLLPLAGPASHVSPTSIPLDWRPLAARAAQARGCACW